MTYTLGEKAIRELRDLKRNLIKIIDSRIRRLNGPRQSREKQVRIARTVSSEFSYPTQSTNRYEVEFGKAEFSTDAVTAETVTFTPYSPTVVKVVHSLEEIDPSELEEGTLVKVRLCHGQWFMVRDSGQGGHPWIRFRADTNIQDRMVSATVELIQGTAINPTTSEALEVNDTVYIHDPNNMWSSIEDGCIGTAFFRPATAEDYPESGDPATSARWEIETCSLPINELEGELLKELTVNDDGCDVEIPGPEDGKPIRSTYPNIMVPPELGPPDSPTGTLTVTNPNKLEGCKGSKCVLRRVTNAEYAEPRRQTANEPRSVTLVEWEIVSVQKRKARWIKGTVTGSQFTLESWWEGEQPYGDCGDARTVFGIDPPCTLENEEVIACYSPEDEHYKMIVTASALMGQPVLIPHVLEGLSFSGCSMSYVVQEHYGWTCGIDPEPVGPIDLDCGDGHTHDVYDPPTECVLVAISVMTDVEQVGTTLVKKYATVAVCGAQTGSDDYIFGTDCEEEE